MSHRVNAAVVAEAFESRRDAESSSQRVVSTPLESLKLSLSSREAFESRSFRVAKLSSHEAFVLEYYIKENVRGFVME